MISSKTMGETLGFRRATGDSALFRMTRLNDFNSALM